MLAARVEPKNGPKNKKAGQILTAFGCVRFQRSEGLLFAEQVELPTVVVTFWRDGLVVTAYSGDWAPRLRVIVVAPGLLFNLVLHAEALAFDDDRVGVVQDAVEDGGGQRAVVVEYLGPMFVDAVGGDHHRCALVALADDLEQ